MAAVPTPDTALPPLGLYIHLPWCERKCPYCDFNSHALTGTVPEADYVAALDAELATEARAAGGRRIESVFIGGGTPSLFSAAAIGRILGAADRAIGLADDAEITLEANPGSAEAERFADYRAAGVNRLSIGVQSFDDEHLHAIGRIHDSRAAHAAVAAARSAGFRRLNLDLMYGLPGQTAAQARADLDTALSLGPDHVSHYELTLEPNTVFHSRPPELPDEDTRWAMQQAGAERLAEGGFARYEISAWSRPGGECHHNLNYWRFGDYLAIGAGAHGKITDADGSIRRYRKHRIPERYMQLARAGDATVAGHALSPANIRFEYMLNALRLVEGIDPAHFARRTGLEWSGVAGTMETLCRDGLMRRDAATGRFRPTERGLDFLNELQARFLPEADTDE